MGKPKHNPEKRAWRGRSHKKGGERVRQLRDIEDRIAALEEDSHKPFDFTHLIARLEAVEAAVKAKRRSR